jgi:hypothetical protein
MWIITAQNGTKIKAVKTIKKRSYAAKITLLDMHIFIYLYSYSSSW